MSRVGSGPGRGAEATSYGFLLIAARVGAACATLTSYEFRCGGEVCRVSPCRWYSRQPARQRRKFLTAFGAICLGLAGAAVGAVVSDLAWGWDLAIGGVALAALVVSALLLGGVEKIAGTVYYVGYQFAWRDNWHERAVRELQKDRRDSKVLIRTISSGPVDGVLDLVEGLTELSRSLESEENADTTDSGFHLAPDMPWPAAVALGSLMYGRWPDQTLHELNEKSAAGPIQTFEWEMQNEKDSRAHSSTQLSVARRHRTQNLSESLSKVVLVTAHATVPRPSARSQAPSGAASTPPVIPLRPWQLKDVEWFGVAAFEDTTAGPQWDTPCKPTPISTETPVSGSGAVMVHPATVTAAVVTAIRAALAMSEDQVVLLAMMVPKTVAVAIGWHLTHDPLETGHSGSDGARRSVRDAQPWKRLVLLQFDVRREVYDAVRVHPDQPDEATQRRLMRELGFL